MWLEGQQGSAGVQGVVLSTRAADVQAASSIERGRGPAPGVYSPPFFWPNLVDGPPPRRFTRGEGAYVVHHALELDAETRVAYCTIVSVDPGDNLESPLDDVVHADSRVAVQRRMFLEFIHRERAFMDRFTSRWREHMVRSLVKQRRFAKRIPWRWARKATLAVVRTQGRFGHWTIRQVRKASRATVHLPDELVTSGIRAWTHMRGRLGRQGIVQGMRDPRHLTNEQKSVVLFLSTSLLVGAIFLMNSVVTLLFPSLAAAYKDLMVTFFLGFLTAIALPFPPSELLVIQPFISAGPVAAFLAIVFSKIAGAWIVYFIGDTLHDFIEESTEGKPRLERAVQWMNRNSEKYGFWILALFMAAPFLPDTLALYVFAVSGTTFRGYLGAAAVGSVLRYGAVVGILIAFGPDRVHELFG